MEGEFGLLEHHMPMVAMLAISRLELVSENERHRFAIAGGMLYFQNDEARILTDSIESEDELIWNVQNGQRNVRKKDLHPRKAI